jgi:hypothetical protein
VLHVDFLRRRHTESEGRDLTPGRAALLLALGSQQTAKLFVMNN